MSEKLNLNFTYRITYPNGKGYDTRNRSSCVVIDVPRTAYVEIAKYTAAGGDLNVSDLKPLLSSVVAQMKAKAIEFDMYNSVDGYYLTKPLKKPREIKAVEVWIDDYDLARFKRMKNIDEVFARPVQSIVLTRNDGSTVKVTIKDGVAEIVDSNKPGQLRRTEEDYLANSISR